MPEVGGTMHCLASGCQQHSYATEATLVWQRWYDGIRQLNTLCTACLDFTVAVEGNRVT